MVDYPSDAKWWMYHSVLTALIATPSFYKASQWTPFMRKCTKPNLFSMKQQDSTVNYLPYVDDNHKD